MGFCQRFTDRMKEQYTVCRLAIRHPRTPRLAKWLLLGAVAYALSPIDLIPDFIPGIGHLDDAIIVPLLIYLGWKFVPPEVKADCLRQARERKLCKS